MDVTFALAFDSPKGAAAATLALRFDGYEVEPQLQADGSAVVAAASTLVRGELDSSADDAPTDHWASHDERLGAA